jgi:hypothetical protein
MYFASINRLTIDVTLENGVIIGGYLCSASSSLSTGSTVHDGP